MKTTIFYFSATGNSFHVAKCLAEKLDAIIGDTQNRIIYNGEK